MYLGIDFCRSFNLAPEIIGKEETSNANDFDFKIAELALERAAEYFGPPKVPGGKHDLSSKASKIRGNQNQFFTFEKCGLGRTTLPKTKTDISPYLQRCKR